MLTCMISAKTPRLAASPARIAAETSQQEAQSHGTRSGLSNCIEACSVTTVHLTSNLLNSDTASPLLTTFPDSRKLSSQIQFVSGLVPQPPARLLTRMQFSTALAISIIPEYTEADIISNISPTFQKIVLPWMVEIGLLEAAGVHPFPCKRRK